MPHVSPDPTRHHEDRFPGFYGSTGWGDAICVIPWVLYTALWRPRHPRRDAAGDGRVERFRLVDQRRADRPSAARLGRPRLHLRRLAAAAGRPRESRCPTIGDDAAATIYLYISSRADRRRSPRSLGDQAMAKRMSERAEKVEAGIPARVHHRRRPHRLRRPDLLCAGLPARPDPAGALRRRPRATSRRPIARASGRIGTGFIGTPALLPALVKIGEPRPGRCGLPAGGSAGLALPGEDAAPPRSGSAGTRIKRRRLDLRAADELLQPLCLWRRLPVAVRGRRRLPARPRRSRLQAHHLRADGHSAAVARRPASTIRRPAASRPAGRVDGDTVTYDVAVPERAQRHAGARRPYKDIAVDGAPLAAAGGRRESAQPARARRPPGDVPDQQAEAELHATRQPADQQPEIRFTREVEMTFTVTRRGASRSSPRH